MKINPTRKLTLKTETLLPLQSIELDRVRGGADDGNIPDFGKPWRDTEKCPPSQSGPATCPVPRNDGLGF